MDDVLTALAPCGLNCAKCFAYIDSEIRNHSNKLNESLGKFEEYAERFVNLLNEPAFKKYPDFKEILDLLSAATCQGCRVETCQLYSGCNVKACTKEKGVFFCYACDEFPCNRTGFDGHLQKRWKKIQTIMKEIGPEKYYEKIKDKPRY